MRNRAIQSVCIGIALLSSLGLDAQQTPSGPATPNTSQAPIAATAPTSVPALVPYSALAVDSKGHPLAGETTATFLIYKDQQGGEPLFTETQTVAVDATGHYTVHLGASNPSGLPTDLFSSGEARWLEVQIAGQEPQSRIFLASVPYALKAADAATLGGLPASAYALAGSKTEVASVSASPITEASATVSTSGGTTNKIPKFTGTNTIGNSTIYDNGTDVGIGTTAPTATLTVDGTFTLNGSSILNGQGVFPAQGTASSSKAYASQSLKFSTSAYNSSSKAVVAPRFQLQAEPTGSDTSSPNGTLNLLASATASSPTETGLYFNTNGTIHFAPSQTFSGSSTSGIGIVGDSNNGTGVQGNSTTSYGVEGVSNSASGVLGYTTGGTLNTAGVTGQGGGTSGFSGIAGVWGDSSTHVGVFGSSSQAAGVLGESNSGIGVQGASTSGIGIQGTSTNSIAGNFSNSSASATVNATNTTSNGGQAVSAVAQGSYGLAVYASETGVDGTGLEAFGNGNGVIGVTNGGVLQTAGVLGIAGSRTSVGGIAGVWGDAQEHVGVIGSSKDYSGVFGSSTNSYGIQGLSSSTAAVYGVGGSSSSPPISQDGPVGVWADTTGTSNGTAFIAEASGGTAALISNSSSSAATVYLSNYGGGGTLGQENDNFRTLEASTADGTCGFGTKGNLTCTGQLKSLATTGSGARTVETYSMQSPENWMEDFGSGELKAGTATVTIEAAFAETVSGTADYHVFLTPQGDSKGLYVTRKTATSFEVHESGGGTATIGFDYRIVAKRRGFEAQRMVDVTEAINAVKTKNEIRAQKMLRAAR